MDEELEEEVTTPEVEELPTGLTEAKINKLKNLKYFKEKNGQPDPWTNEEIIRWYKLRHGNEAPPPAPPERGEDEPEELPVQPSPGTSVSAVDTEEYKKKYRDYLKKFRDEYAVDMNQTNDAEALKQLVRLFIQSERANEVIMEEQALKSPDHRVLKGMGDFQRSLQMNINELQDKLGISRKQRREKNVDSIPKYIESLQERAKDFWNRKTVKVMCEKCQVEIARYWLLFEDRTKSVKFVADCEKCGTEVVYVA